MEYGEVITDGNVSAIIDSESSNYLTNWIKSAIDNGGYYIGRYELGIDWTTNNYGTREGLVSMRTLVNDIGWYFPEGGSAYNRFAYTDTINSFAWDTALCFIMLFTNDLTYANQYYLDLNDNLDPDSGYPVTGLGEDVRCNIYEMAGMQSEWVREYDKTTNSLYVLRGGYNEGNGLGAGRRGMPSDVNSVAAGTRLTLWIQQ